MKDYFNLKKSKLLLFMLFALLAGGVSPAWAETLTETFDDVTVTSRYLLSNGWIMVHNNGNYQGFGGSYDYQIKSGNYNGETGYSLYCNYSDNNEYVVIPTKLTGTFTYYAKRAESNGTITFFEATKDGDDFTITSTQLATTSTSSSWSQKTFDLGDQGKYVAIRLLKSRIDQITATVYVEVSGPALTVNDGSTKLTSPYNYSFGLATTGATKTFTLKNPGTEACPVSVAHTGSFGASLSANSIPADGGEVTLTVTMPEASGSDVITISSTADGIEDFVINVSGAIKDPSKLWCDFTEGMPTGWTNSGSWTIATSGADGTTSGGGYAYNTTYGANKLMYTPLVTIAEGEKLYLQIKGSAATASWNVLKIQYSADGTNWTTAKDLTSITNEWQSLEVSEIPAGNWYIGFYGSNVYFTDIYGGTESTAPVLSLSQASYDFGLIDANKTSEAITITNTGKSSLTGLNITSNNANFTVAVADDATEIAANGGTATFTVTMAPNAIGAQSATITVKSANADDLVFTATGAVAKPGTETAVFNDADYDDWIASGSNLSFDSDETAAYFYYGTTNYLTSPKVSIASDDFLAVEAKMASSYGYVTVQGSADGISWTDIKKLDSSVLNTSDYTTAIVSGISTDYKYLRLNGYYCYVKQVAGLTYAAVLVVKDAENVIQANGLTYAFGEIGANQTVSYIFTNGGASTISITNVTSDNEVFTTDWTVSTEVPFILTITANYDAAKAGEQNGKVTVTTTEGTFEINLTSTFLAANSPKFAIFIGEAEQTTGADLGFGVISSDATKTFIIKNDGTGALNVTSIALPDADYSTDLESAPSTESPLVIAAGGSKTINVTLAASAKAIKTGNIVISATGFDDFSFKADACVLVGTETATFESLPTNWTNTGWTISGGEATADTYVTPYPCLTTAKLVCAEGDFIVVTAKRADNGEGDYIQIQYSTDNGLNWTDLQKLDDNKLPTYSKGYKDIVVSGIPVGTNRLRFQGLYACIKQIAGLTYDANDPYIAVYSNAEATASVTSGTAKDFGWANTAQNATYYIKNSGTGTLTISNIEAPEGFTAVTAGNATTIAANADPLALTVTMTTSTDGAKSGTITLTTDGGNGGIFTIPVSGFMRNADKFYVDFSADGAKFPAGWTTGSWSISGNTAVVSGELQTTTFTAAANETMAIEAISTAGYWSSAALSYSYSTDGGTTWTDAVSVASQLNTSTYTIITLATPNADAATEVQVKLTGSNASVRRIYGFTAKTEPIMTTTATDIAFGMQTEESDEQTFTVSNEGTATLEGLSVTLAKTGDAAEYAISSMKIGEDDFTNGSDLEAGKTVTVYVKQLFDLDNLGSKSDVLTIAATGQTSVAINLTGATRDGSKMYVDFEDGIIPASWTNATTNTWTINTQSGNKYLRQYRNSTSVITTSPLTVTSGENITFDAKSENIDATLTVRYTTDGGITWNDYATYTHNNGLENTFGTKTISGITGTVVLQFDGMDVGIDNFYGGTPTTAPLFDMNTYAMLNSEGKYDFGQTLQAAPAAKEFTLINRGNGNLVSSIDATGDVTFELSTTNGELSNENKTVTLEPGETATITVSLNFDADVPGEKTGTVTITSNAPVAEKTLNFTANVLDATAVYIDFANNSKPEGFYSNGWTYTSGYASNTNTTEGEFITSKLTVRGTTDALTYKASAAYNGNYGQTLNVSYSTDRKTWTTVATLGESDLTAAYSSFTVDGLDAGEYYLRFAGARVFISEISGWHYATPAAEHDFYVSAATFPTTTLIPGTENGVEASATVYSLAVDETGVYAKLFFDETEMAAADAQDIAKDGSQTFSFTANVPATEKTYAAKVVVYNSENAVVWETATANVEVAHTRTLSITDFTREGEGTIDANASNQFDAAFNVTVENTGSTAATPVVKIFVGETEVGTATADAEVAAGESKEIAVSVTGASAGEGGELQFTAKAYWTAGGEALATSASNIAITVNAAAPKFVLYQDATTVNNGDNVMFGLTKAAKTFSYTIKNEGTAALELVSIVAPDGFEATALTDANKTIAANDALGIDVTLKAEQGKKSGNLVITYKVDATTNNTFTLALSGRSVAADTWTESFDTEIPATWTNGSGSNTWTWNDERKTAYSGGYNVERTLMTPRLAAEKDEELTYDVTFQYTGYSVKVEYSSDRSNWTEYATISDGDAGEQSFVAPATGNYYLRFTATRYANLDNFVGFKLNIPEHDTEIAAASVPATGKQYNTYTATVTLNESAGKAEEVTAKLIVNNVEKVTKTETITANGETVVTLTWTPDEVISEAVNAYIAVTGTGIDLATDPVSLTIAEVYTLDETSTAAVEAVTNETVLLKRNFADGWNTVCLPFDISDVEAFFGTGAKAYAFNSYNVESMNFRKASELSAANPYIVYVPAAITGEKILEDITISSWNAEASFTRHADSGNNAVYFRGTYAPVAADGWTKSENTDNVYVLSNADQKLMKAGSKTTMKGFRAYFDAPAASGARLSISFDDETTGIATIGADGELKIETLYNLNGQKVQNTRKGLYIKNGKKTVIR